ncbi:MAG: hypothetical protein M9942_12465 [Microthrixaceae bacterium]|nr:hypothetical protein [Microthrixaceae bacterium]
MLVSAPASSANLGPGFDCLALAVDLPFVLAVSATGSGDPPLLDGAAMLGAETSHPATVAYLEAGGDPRAQLWWRSPIPPGRGLGFSGAARVAGAFAARVAAGEPESVARREAFAVAADLEGHGDNAAASAHGNLAVVAGREVASLELPEGAAVLAWSPEGSTSTNASRSRLPQEVPLRTATGSVARAALWVAAVASGRPELLMEASRDELHQPGRLASRPDSAAVLEALRGAPGVFAAWLSGSGPSVAALVDPSVVTAPDAVALPREHPGHVRLLAVDRAGVHVENPDRRLQI